MPPLRTTFAASSLEFVRPYARRLAGVLVLEIDGGVITETGTHEELCGRGGYYASLVERQRLGFLAEAAGIRAA